MADRYIDLDETQIYGPYASQMIRERVAPLVAEGSVLVHKFADEPTSGPDARPPSLVG